VGGIRFDWSIEMEEKVTKRHHKVGKNNKKKLANGRKDVGFAYNCHN